MGRMNETNCSFMTLWTKCELSRMENIDYLKELVAKADLQSVFTFLTANYEKSTFDDDIRLLSSRYENLKSRNIKGLIAENDYKIEHNKFLIQYSFC